MPPTVIQNRYGPEWTLGFVKVVTPGTPVNLMFNVDPTGANNPDSPTPGTSGAAEYSPNFNQILFYAGKPGASHGVQNNTGNVYIVLKGGSRDDTGTIVAVLIPGASWTLTNSQMNDLMFSPYRYYVDGDNANDGVLVTAIS